jgi:hypothetical protein
MSPSLSTWWERIRLLGWLFLREPLSIADESAAAGGSANVPRPAASSLISLRHPLQHSLNTHKPLND